VLKSFLEEHSIFVFIFQDKNGSFLENRQKGLFNLAPACIVDGDFCLPNEIDS
jgi:hypothetical protein